MASISIPRRAALGGLSVIEYAAGQDSAAVICLHGYGADALDLASLAEELKVNSPLRWIFPDAPFQIGPFAPGRMWFPIEEAPMQAAMLQGVQLDFSAERPQGLDEAVQTVLRLVEALKVPWERVILGGFSQGSMVALEAALQAPQNPLGLFILSGNLVDEAGVRQKANQRTGTKFFQSHGTSDPLLSYEGARRLFEVLRDSGLEGNLRSFEGGHGIPRDVLEELGDFLGKTISSMRLQKEDKV